MTLGRRKVGASCRFIGFILQAQVGETRPRQPDFLDRGVAVERRKRRPRRSDGCRQPRQRLATHLLPGEEDAPTFLGGELTHTAPPAGNPFGGYAIWTTGPARR